MLATPVSAQDHVQGSRNASVTLVELKALVIFFMVPVPFYGWFFCSAAADVFGAEIIVSERAAITI